MRAFITGIAGTALTEAERAFLAEAEPWGVIVFGRNVSTPYALRQLIDDVRATLGRNAPVLVDQEGGRVQQLGPPFGQNIHRLRPMANFMTVIALSDLRLHGSAPG